MFINRSFIWVLSLSFVLLFAGCGGGGGGGDDDDDNNDSGSDNVSNCTIPDGLVSNAGADQNVKTGTYVQLDGSRSQGENGEFPDSYRWNLTSTPNGSSAELSDRRSAAPQFRADISGTYKAELVVDGVECDDASDSVTITADERGANSVPTPDAGDNQTVAVGDTVQLDGSQSTDADGNALVYRWDFRKRPDGSDASISDEDAVSPTFTADEIGEYVLRVRVGDGSAVDEDGDRVTITAVEDADSVPPIADAGTKQSVGVGQTVSLDGSKSRDPNGQLIDYDWELISQPEDSDVDLSGDDTVRPAFEPDVAGSYVAALEVSAGGNTSEPDTVIVVATDNNTQPIADAGDDRNVQTGISVDLDGSGSRDADDNSLAYRWALTGKPRNSQAALVDSTSQTPSFTPDLDGQYVVQLIVSDGDEQSEIDSVVITASQSSNVPVADAGPNRQVNITNEVTLDGTGSSDADNDALDYNWEFISRPDNSDASLSDADSATPTFTADESGFYTIGLTVNDGQADSTQDQVIIIASPALELYVDRSGNGSNYVYLPGGSGQDDEITVQAGSENELLNRFRVKALGEDYTIQNVEFTSSQEINGQTITPYFDNLSEGVEVESGDQRDFATRLEFVPNASGTFQVQLQFSVEPGGRIYNFAYTVEVE